MNKILDWRKSDDPRDIVHLAVQALAEGHVIALPSDCAYLLVASGLHANAVEQLSSVAGQTGNRSISLMMRSPVETLDYFPDISTAARRLARKCWPGPVMLSIQDSHASSVLRCLDPRVNQALQDEKQRIRVWQPDHTVFEYVCRLSSGPLVGLVLKDGSGKVAESIDQIDPAQSVLAIDDGLVIMPGEPTVVAVDGNQGHIVHKGIVDDRALRQIAQWSVLFVCTGNTCRSPMAQALMERKIAEKFGKLADGSGIPMVALSAGVSAYGGEPASHGALAAIQQFGTKLDSHQSTQLNAALVEQADLILAMGQRHKHVIVSQWPSAASKVHLISPDGGEISDPFGGPLEFYQKCASQLDKHTDYWIDRLDVESLIQWS